MPPKCSSESRRTWWTWGRDVDSGAWRRNRRTTQRPGCSTWGKPTPGWASRHCGGSWGGMVCGVTLGHHRRHTRDNRVPGERQRGGQWPLDQGEGTEGGLSHIPSTVQHIPPSCHENRGAEKKGGEKEPTRDEGSALEVGAGKFHTGPEERNLQQWSWGCVLGPLSFCWSAAGERSRRECSPSSKWCRCLRKATTRTRRRSWSLERKRVVTSGCWEYGWDQSRTIRTG